MIVFCVILFVFGLFFGSFASVLIYRLKSGESWIMFWRSKCPKCKHELWVLDLFPFFSYIFSWWKCRHCKKKISKVYPLLELSMWLVFFLVWFTLIDFNTLVSFDKIGIIKLLYFLFLSFIIILFIFYDILFLEIHEWILLTWIWVSLIIIFLQNFIDHFYIIPTLPWFFSLNALQSSISIFLLFSIIWLFYLIMLKWLKEIWDVLIIVGIILGLFSIKIFGNINLTEVTVYNSLIWILIIFIFFFLQILVSKGKWLGWWDLRIAILMGMILGYSYIIPGLMITYFVWSIIWIFIILLQKIKSKKEINTVIPFWPFLWIGLLICLFFQENVDKFLYYYL